MVQLTQGSAATKQYGWKKEVARLALLAALAIAPMLAGDAGVLPGQGPGPTPNQDQPGLDVPQVNWSCRSNCA